MKRKLTIGILCLLAAIVIVLVLFSNENERAKNSGAGQTMIVTQDGKLTVVPQSGNARFSVTMSQSNVVTNTSSRPTVPVDK